MPKWVLLFVDQCHHGGHSTLFSACGFFAFDADIFYHHIFVIIIYLLLLFYPRYFFLMVCAVPFLLLWVWQGLTGILKYTKGGAISPYFHFCGIDSFSVSLFTMTDFYIFGVYIHCVFFLPPGIFPQCYGPSFSCWECGKV